MTRTIVVLAAALAGCAYADDWSKRFEVTAKPELRVETDDGRVTLKAGTGSAIETRVTTKGWTIGENGVRVNARQSGNRVEIDVRVPREHFSFGDRWAHVEVIVPPELRAEVHTGDGHITVQGVRGNLRLNTGDGGIDCDDIGGSVEARTGDGAIKVNGRFDSLDLRTNDGSVNADAAPGSKMAGPWRIHTGDGGVTVRLPQGFAADLNAQTGDGHISVDMPLVTNSMKTSENTVKGQLNGGGPTLRIETGDGSIRIEKH